MKKIVMVFLLMMCAGLAAADYLEAPKDAPEFKYEPNSDNVSQWVLIGIDALSAAFAVWSVLDAENYIREYNELHAEIDDGTAENYEILHARQSEAEKRASGAAIACTAAVAFITYTLADYFFVKEVFPEGMKLFFNPGKTSVALSYNACF